MKYDKKDSTKLLKRYEKYVGESFYDYNKKPEQIVKILNIYINPNDNDVIFNLPNNEICNIAYFNHYMKKNIIR